MKDVMNMDYRGAIILKKFIKYSKFLKMFAVFCVGMLSFYQQASANILITPTRIEFDSRDRTNRLSVVNMSNKKKTYRLYWREQAQTPVGGYITLKKNQRVKGLEKLSRIVRFSPRQITLDPGERQHIRLLVRRPKNMKEGEYRSHLVFEALPEAEEDTGTHKGAKIQVKLNLAFSIPIVLRQGEIDTTAKIRDVEFIKFISPKGKKYLGATVNISRGGRFSSIGNVKILWSTKGSSKKKQIGVLNNVAIYNEIPERAIRIGIPKLPKAEDGTVFISYEGTGSYEGVIFDSFSKSVKKSDFIMQAPAQ